VDVHINPFDLLSEEGEEPQKSKKKQSNEPSQKKTFVFPGDLSGKKKKTSNPIPNNSPKESTKSMNKPTTKESLPNNSPKESTKSMNKPSTKEPLPKASPSPTPNPPGILTIYDVKATRSSISGLISALDEVLGGHTVVFKLQLSPNSNDYYNKLLKEKPYQAISEIIRSDKFNEAFLSALRVKWSAIYEKTTDLRSKPLSIRIEKKLLKKKWICW